MKSLIVYGSQYGSAARYARKLAELTSLPLTGYREAGDLAGYGCIVYLGGLYAGGVKGLKTVLPTLPADARLLLLDEPESALDFQHRHRLLALLRGWAGAGRRAALVALHDPALALNGCDDERLTIRCGNVLDDPALADEIGEKSYDVIVANIVADIIKAMASLFARYLKEDGTLVVSGIISERAEEVTSHLEQHGFSVIELREENDWAAAVLKRA